ncbi:glycosyltransferase family 4 protein [Cohnella hashimotonis]|uniref:Glycosyltransferase family 4 protein n=1 Tax=Cohnella hashimotonis TaxID=2826895 RepID=A0ABT6TGP4_9BACL|nr:glycosyltransferase family 4 protein [Cohnella hashimotonis]MDI4646011.1 glycosyltransferase family 4 protein [Cohnella hashimotonis]
MKLLFAYYVPSGGVETLNRQRIRALRRYGADGHCLYFESGAGLQNSAGLPVTVTSDDIEIKRLLDDGRFDAIVVTSDYMSLKKFRMLGYGGPLILEIQGFGPKAVARRELQEAIPYVQRYASALLNPYTPHIDSIFDEFFPDVPKYRLHNCFDAEAFAYECVGFAPGPEIAWIGRIEDNKNWLEFLLIGARLIHEFDRSVRLRMYEDPALAVVEERERMELWIDRLRLRDRIIFFPNVPNADMRKHLAYIGDSGGFLCSTSKVEGAPYAILEAMSCRCPVLTSDSDGVSSSIFHERTGIYYTLGDINQAYEAAVRLLTDRRLRASIRDEAAAHVRSRFAPHLYCEGFLQMLRELEQTNR